MTVLRCVRCGATRTNCDERGSINAWQTRSSWHRRRGPDPPHERCALARLLLIPEYGGISQLHELDAQDAARVLSSSLAIARAMTNAMPDRRINIGALGNVVPQLHLHHVLRHDEDPAWPGPVWGFGTREPYASDAAVTTCTQWQRILSQLI